MEGDGAQQPLVIEVADADSGASWVYVRDAGPVVIGRGAAAGLQIGRPFVSDVHGTFAYDEARGCWTYADLDSAAGTLLRGRPLRPDEVVPVPPASVLRVGALSLTVLAEAPPGAARAESESPFATAAAPPAETTRLPNWPPPPPQPPAESVTPSPPAPASPIAGGTMRLPESLVAVAAHAPRREAVRRLTERVRPTPSRAGQIAAVAAGAMLASGLLTWLIIRPHAAPPLAPAVEAEPLPLPPTPRPPIEPEPREEPAATAEPPARRAPPARPTPRLKVRRGANGAFVIE